MKQIEKKKPEREGKTPKRKFQTHNSLEACPECGSQMNYVWNAYGGTTEFGQCPDCKTLVRFFTHDPIKN